MAVKLAILPPEVSVPALSFGKPTTSASQAVQAFSNRTAPGLAEANPLYLLVTAAMKSPIAEWNSAPPGI